MTRKATAGLSILVALIVLMAIAAALPYVWKASLDDGLAEAGQMLALIESKTRNAQSSKRAVLANADAVFVKGATPGLASAELQGVLAGLAQDSGMALDKMEARPPESRDGATVLRLEVAATGSIEALRSYLHAIETRVPMIFVTEAHIAPDQAEREEQGRLPSERLTVNLELEALAWLEKAQ